MARIGNIPGAVFKNPRFAQKGARILIDDSFLDFFKGNIMRKKGMIREVEKGFRKGAVIAAESVKKHINMMDAVATGFMRKSITYDVVVDASMNPMIQVVVGTKAWYDILVHEGLGRHGGQRRLPDMYKPSAAQMAVIQPPMGSALRKQFMKKPSPGVPRPFLVQGIRAVKRQIADAINNGMKKGLESIGRKRFGGGTPKHDLKAILFGGTRF